MSQPPRILIFTGDGKGKSTAAFGLALRAAGHGLRVAIVQFVKGDGSVGEVQAVERLRAAGVNIQLHQTGLGFLPKQDSPRFESHRTAAAAGLDLAARFVDERACDVLVLDEVCGAVAHNAVEEEAVCALLGRLPEGMVCVLTGRQASARLIEAADTVTEMRPVKHAYQSGRKAQEGVEF